MMYHGSCLCGAITYQVSGEFGNAYFCHCERCRKASGTAFAANARITPDQFTLLSGHGLLKTYHHAPSGLARKFCGECGSPIVSERAEPAMMAVRLGTVDTPLSKGPGAHIFVDSKVAWDVITDDLPQFAGRPTQ